MKVAGTASPHVDPRWLHQNAHLCQVSTRRVAAEKYRAGRTDQWDITIKRSLGFSKDHIHFSLVCEVAVQGKNEKPLGSIEVEVVGNYKIGIDHPEIVPEDAVNFGNEVAIRDVFPYLRQAVDSASIQVGLGRVKLDPPEPSQSISGKRGENELPEVSHEDGH